MKSSNEVFSTALAILIPLLFLMGCQSSVVQPNKTNSVQMDRYEQLLAICEEKLHDYFNQEERRTPPRQVGARVMDYPASPYYNVLMNFQPFDRSSLPREGDFEGIADVFDPVCFFDKRNREFKGVLWPTRGVDTFPTSKTNKLETEEFERMTIERIGEPPVYNFVFFKAYNSAWVLNQFYLQEPEFMQGVKGVGDKRE